MIRRLLVVGAATAVLAVGASPLPQAEAASTILSAESRGVDHTKVSERSANRLNRKIDRWARRNDLSTVQVGRIRTVCSTTGPLVECKSVARVRG